METTAGPDNLPLPEELTADAVSELEAAVEELNQVIAALAENGGNSK